MGQRMTRTTERYIEPFNGPLEIGLRTISILNEAYPEAYSLQRLVIFDYLVVHSDDIEGGPKGLHPQTPHRSGELLVRREAIQKGLYLYMSRNLVQRRFEGTGVYYSATEHTSAFLDVLVSEYICVLRERAEWLVSCLGEKPDEQLEAFVRSHIDKWGAEFEMESVLWSEETT